MSEETHLIRFQSDDQASQTIIAIGGRSAATLQALGQLRTALKGLGSDGTKAAAGVRAVDIELAKLPGRAKGVEALANEIEVIAANSYHSRDELRGMGVELAKLDSSRRALGSIASATGQIAVGAVAAKQNMAGLAAETRAVTTEGAALASVRGEIVGVQRATFGAFKNAQDLAKGLTSVVAAGAGLSTTTAQMGQLASTSKTVRTNLAGAAKGARRLTSALGRIGGGIATLAAIRSLAADAGEALGKARDKERSGAERNLALRDSYRELANLQGKASPDDATIAGAFRFRLKTGLDDTAANDALRRFEGGLPNALEKGNITGNATSGVAGDFFTAASRTALRSGLNAGTAGLLASKVAQDRAVPSADVGQQRFATILDSLNRGDGDLTPLVSGLVKGSGGFVGQGNSFATLEEFAAAQSVASTNAGPVQSGTRTQQGARGINKLIQAQNASKARREELKDFVGPIKPKKGDGPDVPDFKLVNGDFAGNIERLEPYLESEGNRDNKDQALIELGLDNQAERRSILQFYSNRKVLRKETDTVKRGVNLDDVKRKDATFFGTDGARLRQADAADDAAKFDQFRGEEKAVVSRRIGEASLRRKGEIDTPYHDAVDAINDNVVVRSGQAISRFVAAVTPGSGVALPRPENYPLFLGGESSRSQRVGAEAERQLTEDLSRQGVDPRKARPDLYADPQQAGRSGLQTVLLDAFGLAAGPTGLETRRDAPQDERLSELGRLNRGPNGGNFEGPADATMRQLLRENENQSRLLGQVAQGIQNALGGGFLPIPDRNGPFDRGELP